MTQDQGVDTFFDGSVRSGAPSIKLSQPNDGVLGEIVDQFKAPAKDYSSGEVKKDRVTGKDVEQLVIVLQTDLRNWDRVARIPKVDPNDASKGEKPASEDDGKRAVYVEPYTNLHAAIGSATAVTNGGKPTGLRNGGRLGVKVDRLEDTGKGNPKKVHVAQYTPPAASDGDFFGAQNSAGGPNDASAQPAAPTAPPTPAAPAQGDPWAAQPTQAAPAGDPWASQPSQAAPAAQAGPGAPPF